MSGVVAYLLGLHTIWGSVYEVTQSFFQFPIRYFIFFFGFVIVILSRVVKLSRLSVGVLIVCIVDIFLANPLGGSVSRGDLPPVFQYIVYAEYGGSNFLDKMIVDNDLYEEYAFSIHSSSGTEYTYSNEYNGLSVDCSSNLGSDILTLPKLYYKGYHAYSEDGSQFTVVSWYSNYCEVNIGSYTGSLRLIYEVPIYLLMLFWLQIASVAYILAKVLRRWCLSCIHKRKVE